MLEIVIANTAEAFAPLLERIGQNSDRAIHERDLSGRALFWGGSETIVIAPAPLDPVLVARTAILLGRKRLEVWHPARSTLWLCSDVLDDVGLLLRLQAEVAGGRAFRVRPYAVTAEFCALMAALRWGDYSAALDAAVEIDSKAGFRQAFAGSELTLPEGAICEDASAVAAAVHGFSGRERKCVVKVHNGESGWGLRFFGNREPELSTLRGCATAVGSLFASDPIWAAGPYVVEELIDWDTAIPGFSPSGEASVDEEGARFDYLCDQVLSGDGEFAGVCIGRDVERSELAAELRRQTLIVGEALRAKFYRGSFDVDFIVGRDNRIFAVESNVRLTGGSHVIGAARALFGEHWRQHFFVSNDAIRYAGDPAPASRILALLDPLLLRSGGASGIIVSFISADRPVLGVIAVAATRADAVSQLHAVERCLQDG